MPASRVVYVPHAAARPEAALFAAIIEARGARQALILRRTLGLGPATQHMVDLDHILELPVRLSGLLDCNIAPVPGHA